MRRGWIILLLLLIFALSLPANAKVVQRIYLKEKIDTSHVVKILSVLDGYELSALEINTKKKSVLIAYAPGQVNLAEVLIDLKKLGYHVVRIE